MLSAVPDLLPLSWLETLQRVAALPTLEPIEWFIAAVAMANDLGWPLTHELHGAIGRAYLDRLCAACAIRIDPARTRIVPPSVLVAGSTAVVTAPSAHPPEPELLTPPGKAAPTITQVYEACGVTPVFHPAATRDRPLLSRRSACEATDGFKPVRCVSSWAANAVGVA